MFPSERESDARLFALRRQRDAIEREIADLLRFLELGRRLARAGPAEEDGLGQSGPVSSSWPMSDPQGPAMEAGGFAEGFPSRPVPSLSEDAPGNATGDAPVADRGRDGPDPRIVQAGSEYSLPTSARAMPRGRPPAVPAVAFEDDPVAARRYGRAILDAALDGLREAGRPLHAGEILACVAARGFTVPGHDPVAALNTRLWKRSGPGGPLRRLGDAVYALAEPPAA